MVRLRYLENSQTQLHGLIGIVQAFVMIMSYFRKVLVTVRLLQNNYNQIH